MKLTISFFSQYPPQLLKPGRRQSALVRTLYGVLMLLPQSDAFAMLRCRLNCVPPNHHLTG